MAPLNTENYAQGFLVDEECMGGVTQDPQRPETYVAFVLQHATGEYLGYHAFSDLNSAIQAINEIPRPWSFEVLGGCGSGNCGSGNCGGGKCGKGKCGGQSACAL